MKLEEILKYKEIIYNEYVDYKQNVGKIHPNLGILLKNYSISSLVKAFNVILIGNNQKLLYPSYLEEFETHYRMHKHEFKKQYDKLLDINVNLSSFFVKTSQVLAQIPNLFAASITEIKPEACFVSHTHDPQTICIMDLSNNLDNYLEIKIEDKHYKLNANNPLLIFDGSKLHQAAERGNFNRTYILICCK